MSPTRCTATVLDVSVGDRPAAAVDVVAVPVAHGSGAGGPGGPSGPSGPDGAGDLAVPGGAGALVEAVGGRLPEVLSGEWCQRTGFGGDPGQRALVSSGQGPDVVVIGVGGGRGWGPGRGAAEEPEPEAPAAPGGGRRGVLPAPPRIGELTMPPSPAERWRRAGAAILRGAGRVRHVAVVLPAGLITTEGTARQAASALVEGAALAHYRYDEYRHSGSEDREPVLRLSIVINGPGAAGVRAGVVRGATLADATATARDLVNTPPSSLTPSRMADAVAKLLDGLPGVALEVWDEERVRAERLGGLLGVSRGSAEPPCLLRATYEPPDTGPGTPHVVLVGKGITFDSGGLSLKTADGMTTMKTDMSGAAAVMAALAACPRLEVPVRVTALAPVTENMPGGGAMKPGDVLTIRNGATIEVLNTDAEGRLVLADALSLAAELEPDAIVDLATLTGAATIALGRSVAAVFGTDAGLVERVRAAGAIAGEPSWPLPLPEEYAEHIDSDVADMKNVGRPGQAGSIAAAFLLRRFVGQVPWAHLDIAGPARATESTGYLTKGGTGFGVRTLLELLSATAPDGPGASQVP